MGNDDKGLLEDLIGESLEETQTAATPKPAKAKGVGRMTKEPVADDMMDFSASMDAVDDDSVLGELVQKKRRGGGKRIFILLGIFAVVGFVGALVKFDLIQLPIPKLLYDPKAELKVAEKVSAEQRQKVAEEIKKRQMAMNPPQAVQQMPAAVAVAPPPAKSETKSEAVPNVAPPAPPPAQAPLRAAPPPAPPVVENRAPVAPAPPVQPPPPAPVAMKKPVEKMAPPPSLDGGPYTLQVGAYLFKSSLKDSMAKVVKLGFQPQVKTVKQMVGMHKVYVGNFQSLKTAEAAVKELAEEGIMASVETRSNGNFSALAGTHFYAREAQKQKKKLEEFGFDVAVEKGMVESNMQALRVGSYADAQSAESDLIRLKEMGLAPVVVSR